MEEQQSHYNSLELMNLAFGGSSSGAYYSRSYPTDELAVIAQSNGSPLLPTTVPQWIYCQQITQNHLESLSLTGVPQVEKEMSYCISSGSLQIEGSMENAGLKVDYPQPPSEEMLLNNFTGAEHLILSESSNQGNIHAAPGLPPKVPKSKSRQKSDAARSQKVKIALEALREFLPQSTELNGGSLVDAIIDHVKYLKAQIKDLGQSRLGGEPSCTPLTFHEGYGHYLENDEVLDKPMEELIGKLLEVNPFAATQLLESKGLIMMPAALAEGLPLPSRFLA